MAQWKRDVIYGTVLIIAGILLYTQVSGMNVIAADIFLSRADFYVWLWLIALGFLSVLLIITSLRKKDQRATTPIFNWAGIFTVATITLYLIGMKFLGFLLSTFLFLSVLVIAYSWKMGKLKLKGKSLYIRIGNYLLFALLSGLFVDHIFGRVLSVQLPKFSLF